MLRPKGSHFSLTMHARSPFLNTPGLFTPPYICTPVLLPGVFSSSLLTLANSSSCNIQLKTQNRHGHCLFPKEDEVSPFSALC